MKERKRKKEWFGRRTKWLLGALVVTVAVVPSFWLAMLEQRANQRLVDEVERGLRSDAAAFVQQLALLSEQSLYERSLSPAVEREGYVVRDSTAPSGAVYETNVTFGPDDPVAYPFMVDLADTTAFAGRGALHPDELARVLAQTPLLDRVSPQRRLGRGYVDGPYGPFHYVYTIDTVGVSSRRMVMRGVKVDPEAVKRHVLPEAFSQLAQAVRAERSEDTVTDGDFSFTVETADTVLVLSELSAFGRRHEEALGIYERPLDLNGLFPYWTIRVEYLNELKARRWRSYAASFVPLFIVLLGVAFAARMAMREMELNQVKSLFVSNVSHELKTPLTKINLFNELLQGMPPEASEKRQRYHDIIHTECERLTMLVDNVLDLNRIERGQMNYEFADVPVAEVVSEVAETFNVIYESRGYGIDLSMDDDLPVMHLDPGAIKQALINLTDNAVKYSTEPHTIVVRAARMRMQGQPAVALSVTDRGVGIPKDKIRYIFEEFYRVGDGRVQKASGSGLGLALVRHIVEAHGGVIDVESKVGSGSTFTISLPVNPSRKQKG